MAPDIYGTIPQWLAAVGLGGVLVAVIRRDVQLRGLRNADTADIRDHFAEELTSLRIQIAKTQEHHLDRERALDERWRKLLAESEDRHAECVRQRDEMSRRLLKLEQKLLGTIRQFIHFQQRVADVIAKGGNAVEVLASLQPFTEEEDLG